MTLSFNQESISKRGLCLVYLLVLPILGLTGPAVGATPEVVGELTREEHQIQTVISQTDRPKPRRTSELQQARVKEALHFAELRSITVIHTHSSLDRRNGLGAHLLH